MFRWLLLLSLLLCCSAALLADTLTFANGDQLTGTLVRADSKQCVFQSNMAGTVTVSWSNVRELRTTKPYVLVDDGSHVHHGRLVEQAGVIEIETAEQPGFLAPGQTRMIVDPKTYENAVLARPRLWQGWRGQV